MIRRCLCVVAAGSLGVLGGCEALDIDPNAEGQGLLELLMAPKPLTATLADAQDPFDPDRRARGMLALSMTSAGGDPAYVSLYAENMEDADPSVRAAACKALGRHGRPEHAPMIIKALTTDADPGVRREAARSLQRIHSPEAVEPLLATLRAPEAVSSRTRSEDSAEVRAEAALALAQYRDRKVLQGLTAALADQRLTVNRNALVALKTLTGQDFGYERQAWTAWLRDAQDPFAGATLFEYPAYNRDKSFIEHFPFVPRPPNEPTTTPSGMPLNLEAR